MRLGVARALRDFQVDVPEQEKSVRFVVDQAETAEQAIEQIENQPPDILLLDQQLPGMSGLELLGRLAEQKHEFLTIMITAYASIETAVTATKRGAFDFLPKPFTPAELKNAIRKASAHLALIRRARELAEEKRRVRFEFIRVLGHELKAPLNAVGGYLQIMRDSKAAEKPQQRAQMVDRSLNRIEQMRKLIQDLLDMTRIEAGEKKRELAELDLRQLADQAIETMQPDAEARDIALHLHAPDELVMVGDQSELQIILNNLVSNAVKYNRDGGKVDLTLGAKDGQVSIEVADTGIGMTQAECEKLFNDFVRIKNEKTRNVPGSGLGLSIVKKIAGLYHGSATVRSQPDVGTTFTVTLQRQPAEPESDTDHDEQAEHTAVAQDDG